MTGVQGLLLLEESNSNWCKRFLRHFAMITENLETCTSMADKNYNELNLIHLIFPRALFYIYLFHILKVMKKKSAELSHQSEGRNVWRCWTSFCRRWPMLRSCVLRALSWDDAGLCFVSNILWYQMALHSGQWVYSHKMQHSTFGDMNNHVEDMNQKIKSIVRKNSSLDVMFWDLLLLASVLISIIGS